MSSLNKSTPTPSPSKRGLISTAVLFNATWSVGGTLYRHGVRSVVSDFLQVDVPKGVCPWEHCTTVEFAYVFMPSEQQPQPCVIMHK